MYLGGETLIPFVTSDTIWPSATAPDDDDDDDYGAVGGMRLDE
jgi:hypothetical protein